MKLVGMRTLFMIRRLVRLQEGNSRNKFHPTVCFLLFRFPFAPFSLSFSIVIMSSALETTRAPWQPRANCTFLSKIASIFRSFISKATSANFPANCSRKPASTLLHFISLLHSMANPPIRNVSPRHLVTDLIHFRYVI